MNIQFHGGYGKEVCPTCNFNCGYILRGTILSNYETSVDVPDPNLWLIKLETGAHAVGTTEQIIFQEPNEHSQQ